MNWMFYNHANDPNFINIQTIMHIFFEKDREGKFFAMGTMLNGEDIILTISYEKKEDVVNFIKQIFENKH